LDVYGRSNEMRDGRGRVLGVAVLLAILTGCEAGVAGEPPSATPSTTLGSIPAGTAPIEPGGYLVPKSDWSVADFKVTFPRGWTVQYGHVYAKHFDSADDEFGFYAVVVDEIFADACEGDTGDITKVGPTAYDLAAALLAQRGTKASGPFAGTFGGYPVVQVNLTIPKGLDLNACSLGDIGQQIWYSSREDEYFVLLPHARATVYIVDVDGQRQVFLTQSKAWTSARDRRELQAILDTIHIET
jgi:hypothetical protein